MTIRVKWIYLYVQACVDTHMHIKTSFIRLSCSEKRWGRIIASVRG